MRSVNWILKIGCHDCSNKDKVRLTESDIQTERGLKVLGTHRVE